VVVAGVGADELQEGAAPDEGEVRLFGFVLVAPFVAEPAERLVPGRYPGERAGERVRGVSL